MEPSTAAAPAQPEILDGVSPAAGAVADAPVDLTPLKQAVVDDNFAAFRKEKQAGAKIDDAPKEKAPEPVTVAPTKEEARTVSKRQERINEYERRIAEQDAELARFRSATAQPVARTEPVATVADPADPEPNPTDTAKYPDGQYDPKFIKDLGAHAARQEFRAAQTAAATARAAEAQATTFVERDRAFATRLADAKKADPDLMEKLSPEVRALRPLTYFDTNGRLVQVEQPTVLNAIAEEILRSEHPSKLMLHLSDTPEAMQSLAASRNHSELVRAIARLEFDLTRETAVAPKTVSSAPPPAPTLGARPTEGADPVHAAVVNDDFRAFRAAKQAARAGRR